MQRIAIIGAGLSGLVLARELQPYAEVTLFEKSRGVGGRLATRYAGAYQFDHGAQFFTAESDAFRQFLEPLVKHHVVGYWQARFAELAGDHIMSQRQWNDSWPHYIGLPKMNAIGKYLAKGLNIQLQTQVKSLHKTSLGWELSDETNRSLGQYDWVISTAPAKQAKTLMPACFRYHKELQNTSMVGCFALMLGFTESVALPWDAALVKEADISWISVNSSKTGRPDGFSMVVLATNQWAEAHMEDDREGVVRHLLAEASRITGKNLGHAAHIDLHRWRYANISKQVNPVLFDRENQLAACGDWCVQGLVEAAFTSACNLAEALKPHIQSDIRATV